MKIKFELNERRVISGFLYATKYRLNTRKNDIEYSRNLDTISEEEFEIRVENLKRLGQRLENLVGKFGDNVNFVKIKARDAVEIRDIVKTAILEHEKDTTSERPVLSENDYIACKSAVEKIDNKIGG